MTVTGNMEPPTAGEKTTRERIFDVALDLFAQKGYDAVSMREIAEAVGIKKASLYSHFTGKDELLEQIFEYPMARIADIGPPGADAEQMIVAMGVDGYMAMADATFKQWIASPKMEKIWRLLLIELYHNVSMKRFYEKFTNEAIDFWRSNFSIMLRHKLIKPLDADTLAREYMAFYQYAFMDYFIVNYGTKGPFLEVEEKMIDDHVAFLVRSIKA